MIDQIDHVQIPIEKIQLLRHEIESADQIMVTTHIRPDGDAIGSTLGLGMALSNAGKEVQMVSVDGVPAPLAFIEGSELIRKEATGDVDLIIVLDCSDLERPGAVIKDGRIPDWNIDHHITNLYFARENIVNPSAVATAELIADIIAQIGLGFTPMIASALLTGLVTDTLGFQTSNMTPKALKLGALLMEKGANLPDIYRKALINRSFTAIRFWASGLSNAEMENRLIWTTLSMKDRYTVGYSGRDDADLIQILASVEDADIAIIFVEQPKGKVKVGWRAQPGFDVSQIALQFGGGGHPAASGADLTGSLEEVKSKVLSATRPLLEKKYEQEL